MLRSFTCIKRKKQSAVLGGLKLVNINTCIVKVEPVSHVFVEEACMIIFFMLLETSRLCFIIKGFSYNLVAFENAII